MKNPTITATPVDPDATSQRTATTSTNDTATDNSSLFDTTSYESNTQPSASSSSLRTKLQQLHIPTFNAKLLQLPSPFEFFVSNSASPSSHRSRARSISNASVLSNLSVLSSSRPPTPAYSTVSTPVPTAPSTPQLSPVPSNSSGPPEKSYESVLIIPLLWTYLTASGILAVSTTCKTLRQKLCRTKTFCTHLEGQGWDTEAVIRRTEVLQKKRKKGRQCLHVARTAVGRGDISKLYGIVNKARESIGEKEIEKKFGTKKATKKEYTTEERRAIDKLLQILVDCAVEHDKNNFFTLTELVTKSFEPPHSTFIHFLSSIPSYNWKSYSRKAFVLAAYLNQQPSPDTHDTSLDYLASGTDFWRDGAQKVEKSLSLNNTRAALLYSKGLTAFLPRYLQSPFNLRQLNSIDYDASAPSIDREVIPGLGRAIKRFEDAVNGEGNTSLELEGAYWKPQLDECPCSPMHMSISSANSSASETNSDTSSNVVQRSKAKLKSSLASLSIPNIGSLSHTKPDLQFDITVSDRGANPPWTMSCMLDCTTGRGQMVGSTPTLVYNIWVTPWGVVGHKMRILKSGTEESLGDFVLVWGKNREVSESGGVEQTSETDLAQLQQQQEPEEMSPRLSV